MNIKLLKKIGIISGAVIGVIYILFLILPLIISPILSSYLPQINTEINKACGLNSKIEKIRIVTTPKLTVGIKVGEFELLTPDNREIVELEDFQLKVSLIPLLARKIELDSIQADEVEAKLNLNKDGSFELEKYFVSDTKDEKSTETATFSLPFGLKLSNHLPDIKIGKYDIDFVDLSNKDKYELKGENFKITDFVLDKRVKFSTKGNIVFKGREQFVYKIKIDNKIMPELSLNDMVFNLEPQEEKAENVRVDILAILKGLYKNNVRANLNTDIKTEKTGKHLNFHGYAKIDNLATSPNGLEIPASKIELLFKGKKIDIDTDIYTAKNEVSELNGEITTGEKTTVDLNFKSQAELANIIRILNAYATTFNINDLQTLSAKGKIDANFNIKSNLKKVTSNGYFKIPYATLTYGLYNVKLDDIKTDIALDNNNIDIKEISFRVLNQPLKIFGTIKQDATTDIHAIAQRVSIKGLLVACGQAALMKENAINSGYLSLNFDLTGKLNKLKPAVKICLNDIDIKNIPLNTTVKLPQTDMNLASKNNSFEGIFLATGMQIINPAITVSDNRLMAKIKENSIEIEDTTVKADKIYFNLSGVISNYLTEKIALNLATKGDINSTLTGDVNTKKQTLNLNFVAPKNNTIIIPMFDKSKMVFKGNTSITGSMLNPVLNGTFNISSVSIPEIPVTMDNVVVKLAGPILYGKCSADKFTSGGIVAENLTTDFAMKGENFYLNNIKGNAFDGSIKGNIIYNLANAKTSIDFSGSSMSAEKAIRGAAGIKDAMSGTLSFDTKLSMLVLDYDKMMKSMTGNFNFKVTNGAFGSIGRIENMLGAGNVLANSVLKTTVSTLSNLAGIKNSAKFDYITGDFAFANGWANIKSLKSTGPTLAYYVTGKYNLLNGTTNAKVLGRLDGSVVALLGPLGDMTTSKLLSYIPKFGSATASIVNAFTASPKSENTSLIPALSNNSKNYKDFKVVYNGGLESKSSVKSFQWLTTVDTSAIQTQNVADTVKSIKSSFNTDTQNVVNQYKNTVDSIKTQQQMLKNSAEDLKNLFKF